MADFVEDVLRPVVVSLTLRSFHSLVGSKTEQDVWMVRGGPGSEHGPSSGGLLCPVVRAVPAAGPGVEAPGQAGAAHARGHRGQGTAWLPPLLLLILLPTGGLHGGAGPLPPARSDRLPHPQDLPPGQQGQRPAPALLRGEQGRRLPALLAAPATPLGSGERHPVPVPAQRDRLLPLAGPVLRPVVRPLHQICPVI